MTSDSAKQETASDSSKQETASDSARPDTAGARAKPESFRSHLPAIAAATAGTLFATLLGSLIGVAGTLVGITIGSLLSGTISWWTERGLRRSAAVATARAEAIRAHGRPLHPDEDAVVAKVAAASHDRGRQHRRWVGPAAFIVAAFIGCAVPLTLLEHATGKPLSAVVQGKPGNGTTLGGGHSGASASHSPSPSPSARATGSATASSTAPGGASSSPAVSSTPVGTAPASTSPPSTSPASTSPASNPPASATPSAAPATTAPG
jgi:hypothetical protein